MDEKEFGHMLDEATGANEHSMFRGRPYDGQPWTDSGERGQVEITGLTFRDLRDCFVRAVCQSCYGGDGVEPNRTLYFESQKGDKAAICANDIYSIEGSLDLMAVAQNLNCEVERLMGIFPNTRDNYDDDPTIKEIKGL